MTTVTAPAVATGRVPRPLVTFTAVALPTGWVLLSVPLLVDVPVEPFVLGTLLLGLVLPALVLTRRDPGASVRRLLADTVRPPYPWWLLLPAALLLPATTAGVAALLGGASAPTGALLTGFLSSLLVVNLWEEMAWAGFVQRRAAARWGPVRGAVAVALLFTGIHLPLALYDAGGVGDVARNVAVMIVSGVGLRLLIGAFDVWGRGSILALAVVHATFNATADLLTPDAAWVRYAVTLAAGVTAAVLLTRRGVRR